MTTVSARRTSLLRWYSVAIWALALALPVAANGAVDADQLAERIYAAAGVRGGVVVHLGCGDGKLTAALHAGDGYLVQGLDSDFEVVQAARATVNRQGLYGKVSIHLLQSARLPFIDNLVNLVVVERSTDVARDEIMRVLCPKGVALILEEGNWTKLVKPRPEEIDQWTHYLYDASNNAVAHDTVVGPPRRMQWTDGPRYARHHDRMSSVSAVVSASGRVFSIEDEQSAISILLPSRWMLTARDAFNGTTLWKRPIEKWFTQFWPLKSGPAQLPRRLVASGDRVYVTLGFDAPFVALDAATGETVQEYDGTDGTEEAILSKGVLYLLVNSQLDAGQYSDPQRFNKAYRAKFWDEKPRQLMAFQAATGRHLWSADDVVLPATLSANAQSVVYHNGSSIICLDGQTGKERWKSKPIARAEEIQSFYLPILVLHEDVVLFSGGETAGGQTGSWYEEGKDSMTALDLEDGNVLWTAHHPPSGYRSPEDMLVANGLVWTGETTSGRAVGKFTGRDPRTGKVESQFEPDVSTYWFHHRCYRGKGTDNYLLMSRTGTEFVDIREEKWDINHWVRGACLYGVMPANGLLYAPRHPCACYLEAKMSGFNALAPKSSEARIPIPIADAQRLAKGPAYGKESNTKAGRSDEDWPTFRHDSGRTGHASTAVPAELQAGWSTTLGGKVSSPVVADGRVFVASVEDHTVHALDAATGKPIWRFQASGRVDSPPTIYQGLVLFGSADGNVYCLRATDGEVAWQFTAALARQQLVSFGQLESVWPVHGSVLIENDVLYFVAGRSMFVDGGMLLWRLNPETGGILSKTTLDEIDTSGASIQDYVSWLNMPTALPDVLSSSGRYIYMRSQPFELSGARLPLQAMPKKGDADRGAPDPYQVAEHAHIFSPTGFLDDSWWHRTYWLYGSTFISGWSGYYLSGKIAPAGRLLVTDNDSVYGFGRKPQYFRWTTPIEHQLFRADKELQVTMSPPRKGPAETRVTVEKSQSLDPSNKAVTVEAWVKTDKPNGVVVARGGGNAGYALYFEQGKPTFAIRSNANLSRVQAEGRAVGKWVHLVGVLTEQKALKIFVNGVLAGEGAATALIHGDPLEGMEIGADEGSNVGEYVDRGAFNGLIDEVKVYDRALEAGLIKKLAGTLEQPLAQAPATVFAADFNDGTADDKSGNGNRAAVEGAVAEAGRAGKALRFLGDGLRVAGHTVDYHWTEDLALFARAMVLTNGTLFLAGPPDLVNEETSFRRISDPQVQERLLEQVASIEGKSGAILLALSAVDGNKLAELKLDSPPVFDGMIAAGGALFISTVDGKVICLK